MTPTDEDLDPLSLERLRLAHETLQAIFGECVPMGDFPGAIQERDVSLVFSNAGRNLIAFVQHRHGTPEWEKANREWF